LLAQYPLCASRAFVFRFIRAIEGMATVEARERGFRTGRRCLFVAGCRQTAADRRLSA